MKIVSGGAACQIMSVLATPVSTLTYRIKQARRGLSTAAATRKVKRLLGIPRHFDDMMIWRRVGPQDYFFQ